MEARNCYRVLDLLAVAGLLVLFFVKGDATPMLVLAAMLAGPLLFFELRSRVRSSGSKQK